MAMINHKRSFGLQTPSSDGVIIGPADQMLITNRYSHRKDRSLMPNQLICLGINFIVKIKFHLLLYRFSLVLLTCFFLICFLWLILLLLSWTLLLFLVFFFWFLVNCWLIFIFQVFLNLLSNHLIYSQHIVLLL